MKQQIFKNNLFEVTATLEDGEILFDAEQVAESLGITQIKGNQSYVRWERVNDYLPSDSPLVGKGDLIPEPMVYKLAFKAQNEVAEQFQDWLAIEVIPQIRKTGSYSIDTSQLSPELQAFNNIFQSLAKQELATKQLETKLDNIADILSLNMNDWRNESNKIINVIATKLGGGQYYKDIRKESYELLEERGKCKLNVRLNNRKNAMAGRGMSKTSISKLSKLDIIAEDNKLISVYITVIKDLAVKYQLNLSDYQLVLGDAP